MANRLANETSPYLLQHAHNPVDWYPWGEEAFARAAAEDKPIFLSIGYSACHWCHVMERESFENEAIAAQLNRDFISIKVDREERPDVDSIYMTAVQMISGHGGWPMSMFLTPDRVPFWGGTYFPPDDRYGRPGFPKVLDALADAWKNDRVRLQESAGHILGALRSRTSGEHGGELTRDSLIRAAHDAVDEFDRVHGGFGTAPKFPPSMTLELLLQIGTTTGSKELMHVVTHTLRKMGRGGLFDQIGGGFHRYSVDERWLVPHFEKMLYDNALLARVYLHAWQATGDDEFLRVTRETLDWVLREMTSPEGGFYSTLDADSEGEEGKFYVWSRADVIDALGEEEGAAFCALYDITEGGNFEGHNIPNLPRDPVEVAESLALPIDRLLDIAARGRCKLFGLRETRVRPGRDEKILAGWNGWMLAAFSEAALVTGEERYLSAARANAAFILDRLLDGSRLKRSFKDGRARIDGVLEDYAGAGWGLARAFEATGERRFLDAARTLADAILERFPDPAGGFFDTPADGEKLITRPKDLFDNATPSGNSLAAELFALLALWFDENRYREASADAVRAAAGLARRYPTGFGFVLSAAGWHLLAPREIVITGPAGDPERAELLSAAATAWMPHRIVLASAESDLPLAQGRDFDSTAAWVCENYACRAPVTDVDALRALLTISPAG